MKIPLDELEARLQSLIEGSVARLFPIINRQADLAEHLIQAMRGNIHLREDGGLVAPNRFLLSVHPAQAKIIAQNAGLEEELARLLHKAAGEAGLEFPSPPTIVVQSEEDIGLHETRILAQFDIEDVVHTTTIDQEEAANEAHLINAYLIVNGTHIHPLTGGVVNIGRGDSNTLVVKDQRVSRSHAQLRLVGNRYVIFDLDSTGGTFVNDQRVNRTALSPGDVISLAGVPLIFGQDISGPSGETQELPPFSNKPT
jgi:hypothetical protein